MFQMKELFKAIGILIIFIGVFSGIFVRFLFPDMTSVRFIIEYWDVEIFSLFCIGIGGFIFNKYYYE